MRTGTVYILKDPQTNLVRYVGQTIVPINNRFAQHLYNWKRSGNHVNSWVKSLQKQNLKPVIEIVEDSIQLSELDKKEIQYIVLYKAVGAKLCNHTAGGAGLKSFKVSEHSKQKRLKSLKTSSAWKARAVRHSEIMKNLHAAGEIGFHNKLHSVESKLKIGASNPYRKVLTIKDKCTGIVTIYPSKRAFAYNLGYKSENAVVDFVFNKRSTHLHLKYEILENKTAAELKAKKSASGSKGKSSKKSSSKK